MTGIAHLGEQDVLAARGRVGFGAQHGELGRGLAGGVERKPGSKPAAGRDRGHAALDAAVPRMFSKNKTRGGFVFCNQ